MVKEIQILYTVYRFDAFSDATVLVKRVGFELGNLPNQLICSPIPELANSKVEPIAHPELNGLSLGNDFSTDVNPFCLTQLSGQRQ